MCMDVCITNTCIGNIIVSSTCSQQYSTDQIRLSISEMLFLILILLSITMYGIHRVYRRRCLWVTSRWWWHWSTGESVGGQTWWSRWRGLSSIWTQSQPESPRSSSHTCSASRHEEWKFSEAEQNGDQRNTKSLHLWFFLSPLSFFLACFSAFFSFLFYCICSLSLPFWKGGLFDA